MPTEGAITVDLGGAELEELLERSRQALTSIRSARPATSDVRGRAADGKVEAVASGGRISGLELDPRVMRTMTSADLARHIVTAVNGALDDLTASSADAEKYAAVDMAKVSEQIAEIQLQSVRQMAAINQAIETAMRQVRDEL